MALLRDILSVHKVFMFGAFNCSEYTLDDFLRDIKMAETGDDEKGIKAIFGETIISPHVVREHGDLIDPKKFKPHFTLYPEWLIADDLFAVFRRLFAVSQWAANLQRDGVASNLNIFCSVIPEKVVSLYDDEAVYEHSIGDIAEWLSSGSWSVDMGRHRVYSVEQDEVMEIVERIEECSGSIKVDEAELIVLVFDRRNWIKIGTERLTVFRCQSMDSVVELTSNHFIGMHFNVECGGKGPSDCVARSWLHYGNGQRLRFWPEQLVWFIPRLFVNRKQSGYRFAERLYSDHFKHGFCLKLNDPIFDRFYLILTRWKHQSVNYRRSQWMTTRGLMAGFRDYVEAKLSGQPLTIHKLATFWAQNAYSSDDILEDVAASKKESDSNIATVFDGAFKVLLDAATEYGVEPEAECTLDHPLELWHCHYAQEMIGNRF